METAGSSVGGLGEFTCRLFPKRSISLILARVNFECCDSIMSLFMLGDRTNSNQIQAIQAVPATFFPWCRSFCVRECSAW